MKPMTVPCGCCDEKASVGEPCPRGCREGGTTAWGLAEADAFRKPGASRVLCVLHCNEPRVRIGDVVEFAYDGNDSAFAWPVVESRRGPEKLGVWTDFRAAMRFRAYDVQGEWVREETRVWAPIAAVRVVVRGVSETDRAKALAALAAAAREIAACIGTRETPPLTDAELASFARGDGSAERVRPSVMPSVGTTPVPHAATAACPRCGTEAAHAPGDEPRCRPCGAEHRYLRPKAEAREPAWIAAIRARHAACNTGRMRWWHEDGRFLPLPIVRDLASAILSYRPGSELVPSPAPPAHTGECVRGCKRTYGLTACFHDRAS